MFSRKWLVVFGAVALVILVILNWGYRQALHSLTAELDDRLSERLLILAENLAVQIDPKVAISELDVEDFVDLFEFVQQYRRANDLADVRLLDSEFVDLLNETPDSLTVEIVSRLDYPTFLPAISGFPAVSETYRGEESYYKSAYAPIINEAGAVLAVVRVEADADFFAVVDVFGRGLWLSHLLSLVFVVAVGGLFFWFFRRQAAWERQLLLSEKLLAMGRMASVIAHEIRNPLGIIKATAQRLAKLEPEKQKPLLEFIPEEIDRLNQVLTGYLQFADIRVQPPQPVSVSEIVQEVIKRAEQYCREKEIDVVVQIDDDCSVFADGEALGRALENLIRNAADASEKGSKIEIICEKSDRTGHIIVADRGTGVAKKDRKRIFEPFHTTRAQGSGLGLYAARSSLQKMGGELSYRPRKGGGCLFIMELPLVVETEKS